MGRSPVDLNSSNPVLSVSRRYVAWLLAAVFLVSAALIFTRLGHYALWDDEAESALEAESVLRCGDTQAKIGHNFILYRNGMLLKNLRTEGEPPFCAYFAAPFLKLFGANAWGARFPFALCGLATVGLLCWWVWKWRASLLTAAVFSIALLGNVSFFLYTRQCRYYGPALLFFTAAGYLYLHWEGNRRKLVLMGLCAALLMAANYSFYLLLFLCLGCDYWIWQQKVRRFGLRDFWVLAIPSLLMGIIILVWWNPFHTGQGDMLGHNSLAQRFTLFLWHWRDMNESEMIIGGLLIFAPWAAFVAASPWLKRGLVILILYTVGLTAISIQTVAATSVSDVRYFCAMLPLIIALSAFTFLELARRFHAVRWAVPIAFLVFGTNFLQGGMFLRQGLRSTPVAFVRELAEQPPDPYSAAADWLRANAAEGASVWVTPNGMVLPLIFHAPHVVYGWQLSASAAAHFASLPPILVEKKLPPDYVIAFGPAYPNAMQVLDGFQDVFYEPVALLDVFWKDLYRPEILWRCFEAVRNFDPQYHGIYILKRKELPPPLKDDESPAAAPAAPAAASAAPTSSTSSGGSF